MNFTSKSIQSNKKALVYDGAYSTSLLNKYFENIKTDMTSIISNINTNITSICSYSTTSISDVSNIVDAIVSKLTALINIINTFNQTTINDISWIEYNVSSYKNKYINDLDYVLSELMGIDTKLTQMNNPIELPNLSNSISYINYIRETGLGIDEYIALDRVSELESDYNLVVNMIKLYPTTFIESDIILINQIINSLNYSVNKIKNSNSELYISMNNIIKIKLIYIYRNFVNNVSKTIGTDLKSVNDYTTSISTNTSNICEKLDEFNYFLENVVGVGLNSVLDEIENLETNSSILTRIRIFIDEVFEVNNTDFSITEIKDKINEIYFNFINNNIDDDYTIYNLVYDFIDDENESSLLSYIDSLKIQIDNLWKTGSSSLYNVLASLLFNTIINEISNLVSSSQTNITNINNLVNLTVNDLDEIVVSINEISSKLSEFVIIINDVVLELESIKSDSLTISDSSSEEFTDMLQNVSNFSEANQNVYNRSISYLYPIREFIKSEFDKFLVSIS